MKVFLSWSGEKSEAAAKAMRNWITYVVNAVEPWMSTTDIDAGARWGPRIDEELQNTRIGIVFVTRGNVNAPWLLFETGAIAKAVDDSLVCPYLIDIAPADMPPSPLTQFQAKVANYDGTLELLRTLNCALDCPLSASHLEIAFERFWPDFEAALDALPEDSVAPASTRRPEEMIEEILTSVRRLERSAQATPNRSPVAEAQPKRFAVGELPESVGPGTYAEGTALTASYVSAADGPCRQCDGGRFWWGGYDSTGDRHYTCADCGYAHSE